MNESKVPITELLHRSGRVFERLQHERRMVITRAGRAIGVLSALDPDEAQLDDWAAAGEVPADWREQQQQLRDLLRTPPPLVADPDQRSGTTALLAERDEDDR